MVVSVEPRRLLGRQREQAVLERVLETAREGHGGVLVVHGDPGVGKTALLDYALDTAKDFRVVRTSGVEGETELDYAALQQLCAPLLTLIERLPDPQRDALGVAFGLSPGRPPSPFLVGLAVLGLLSKRPSQQPLLCMVDDAQWLDDASGAALRSSRVGCSRKGSPSRLRLAAWEVAWSAFLSSVSIRWAVEMHGRSWSPSSLGGWTNPFSRASLPKPGATRLHCSSSPAG
jgi:hypothetical protein